VHKGGDTIAKPLKMKNRAVEMLHLLRTQDRKEEQVSRKDAIWISFHENGTKKNIPKCKINLANDKTSPLNAFSRPEKSKSGAPGLWKSGAPICVR
jgi:hypothetical protein